jgi:hypothetical protein
MRKLAVPVPISLVDKTISEDSEGFMDPQVDQASLVLEILEVDHQDTLDNLRQISQIEGVVALRWSRQEVGDGLLIEVHRGLDDGLGHNVETR